MPKQRKTRSSQLWRTVTVMGFTPLMSLATLMIPRLPSTVAQAQGPKGTNAKTSADAKTGAKKEVELWVPDVREPLQNEKPIPQDPLLALLPPSGLKGTLIYNLRAAFLAEPPPHGDFFAVHHIGQGAVAEKPPQVGSVTYIPVEQGGGNYVMGIQFLTGGQRIMFKLGWPFDRSGDFEVYLLDLQTQKVQRVTKERLVYEDVKVSPDGSYIAYIRNADRLGNPLNRQQPLQLVIEHAHTHQTRIVVADNSIIAGAWAWTPQNTLLYSVVPLPSQNKNAPGNQESPPRPAIYEVPGAGGTAQLLVRDGWRPLPSPDGQWIAFFGAPDPQQPQPLARHWDRDPNGAALSVVKRDGNERKTLTIEKANYPQLLWQADSRHLIATKTVRAGAQSSGLFVEFDVQTKQARPLAQVDAQDSQALPRPLEVLPPFKPMKVTNDGRFVLATAEQLVDPGNSSLYDQYTTLLAINLRDGTVSEVARLKNAWGLDWYDESSPAPSAEKPAEVKAP